jgi:RNA polymerase sigma factor (sigma-70 family)
MPMTPTPLQTVLRQLRQRLAAPEVPAPSDGQLLRRFARLHEEAAFEALVRQHGPMVWGVCRRLLPEGHDAEDAFQATFLVLLQKAASIREHDSAASWLYGVARRVARRARANADRRRGVERQAPLPPPQPDGPSEAAGREVLAIVEEELARLPERFRAPLMLCGLGGLSKAEAARQLGCKTGTVASRLARARERLRGRLARRGVIVPAAAVGGLLTEGAAPAAVPAPLITVTVRTAALFLAGGGQSTAVAMLARGAAASTAARLKVVAALLLGLTVLGAGAGLAAHRSLGAGDETAEQRRQPEPAPRADGASPALADAFGDPLPPGALARMGTVRLRQPAYQVAFAPDGKTLVTTGPDHRINTWDAGTGKYLHGRQIEGTQDFDRSATTLAPDGKAAVVWLWSRQSLLVCEAPTGRKLGSVSVRAGQPYRAAVAPGGKAVAASITEGNKHVIRIWDVAAGTERQLLEHDRHDEAIAFSPDGKLLAVGGGMDEALRVWDVAAGTLLHRIARRTDHGLAFSPDSKTLAAWCDDRVVRLWDMATGKEQAAFRTTCGFCLAFAPDGKLLAGGGPDGLVLWDVAARKELHRLPAARPWALAFAPDGKTLAASGGGIQLWDVATGKQLLAPLARAGHGDAVDSLAVSPDGKVLASACYGEGTLCLWDAGTGKLLHRPAGRDIACRFNCFSPDGKLLASGGHDGSLHLWETATGKEWRGFPIEEGRPDWPKPFVDALALSADGKRLAALTRDGGDEHSLQINVWDTASGKLLKRRGFEGGPFSSFTPDANGIAVRTEQGLAIQDTLTGKELATIPDVVRAWPVAFSPGGRLLATVRCPVAPAPAGKGGKGFAQAAGEVTAVSVAELATGKEVVRIETGRVNLFAFSPDGRVLATSDGDAVRVWETATGKEVFRRERHGALPGVPAQAAVASVAFLPGGRRLATGLGDGTVLVWDLAPEAAAGKELQTLWADLAGEDARKAYRAIHGLAAAPAQAVAYLKEHLRPVPEVEPRRVERLLADLDSSEFTVREAAAKELTGLAERVEPALRRALKESPSAEVRRCVEALLAVPGAAPTGDTLRALRAVWVLELVGTPEARQLLEALAKGAAAARQTVEAKAALERLSRRVAAVP